MCLKQFYISGSSIISIIIVASKDNMFLNLDYDLLNVMCGKRNVYENIHRTWSKAHLLK